MASSPLQGNSQSIGNMKSNASSEIGLADSISHDHAQVPNLRTVSDIISSIRNEVSQAFEEHKDSPDESWKQRTRLKIANSITALDMRTAFYVGVGLNGFCLTGFLGWGVGAIGGVLGKPHVAAGGIAYGASMSGVAPFLHAVGGVGMVYGAPAIPPVQRRLKKWMPRKMHEFEELIAEARRFND